MLASTALVIASLLSACDTTPVMLHGTVTTAGGSKLNAIQVVVYSNDTDTVIASTATDTSGRYSFHESVLPEGTYRVKIWGQWFTDVTGSGNPQPVTVSAAAPAVADQQFSAVGSLVGSVVNPDGSPVPGVLVSLKDSAGNIVSTNTSGDDGSFSVETPTAGTYTATLVPASNPDNWHDIGGDDATSFAITSGQVFAGPIIVDSGLPYWPNLALNKVDAGLDHTCAIGSGGTVKCWGHNSYGQLGNGTTFVDAYSPVSVVGITDAISVTSGNEYSCALHAGGTISCWGQNPYGQLGNGTYTDSDVPVAVVGITDAVAVSAGYLHTCAVHADGTVSCWGLDLSGALGDGYTSGGLPGFARPASAGDEPLGRRRTGGRDLRAALLLDPARLGRRGFLSGGPSTRFAWRRRTTDVAV